MKKIAIAQLGGVAALALGASVAMGLPAQAAGADGGTTKGTCSGDSSIKVQVTSHKDELVIKAKLSGGHKGDTVTYVIADNGTQVVTGDQNTSKNGKTTIRESIPNLDGTDTIDFTSLDAATGETCTAQVVYNR
jgi:hypothetical protein